MSPEDRQVSGFTAEVKRFVLFSTCRCRPLVCLFVRLHAFHPYFLTCIHFGIVLPWGLLDTRAFASGRTPYDPR